MENFNRLQLHVPHLPELVNIPLPNTTSIRSIRAHFGRILGCRPSQTAVYRVLEDRIELIPSQCDDLVPMEEFDAPVVLYGSPQEHRLLSNSPIELSERSHNAFEPYYIEVITFSPRQSQMYNIAEHDRVSDLINNIHRHSELGAQSPRHIRLQSLLPHLPILVSMRALVRDLLPRNTSIYAVRTAQNEPPNREFTHMRRINQTNHQGPPSDTETSIPVRPGNRARSPLRDNHDDLTDTTVHTDMQQPMRKKRKLNRLRAQPNQTIAHSPNEYVIRNLPFIPRHVGTMDSTAYDASISANMSLAEPSEDETRTSKPPAVRMSADLEEETTEEDFDDTFKSDSCCNCKRTPTDQTLLHPPDLLPYEPRFIEVNLDTDLRITNRRKFFYVNKADYEREREGPRRGTRHVCICAECYAYLSLPPEQKPNQSVVWPSFIWSTLVRASTFQDAWKLLPTQWKLWWLRAVAQKHQVPKTKLLQHSSAFVERSKAQSADIEALKGLRWAEDVLPRELSFVLAEVKCPAGCGEFKHKTNALPLDIVFQHLLSEDFELYSSTRTMLCTNWFRDDYLLHDRILWNTSWTCTPSIAYCKKTMVPTVLSCRNHTTRHKRFMLHPCRHELGTIATEKSSQFSPVTPIPRTLKAAEYSAYSGSFRVAKMEGSFHGLDTMFLSADGGNYDYQSTLAWEFERIAATQRQDLQHHIQRLSDSDRLDSSVASALTEHRPSDETYLTGSTYVDINDAVRLQNNLFYGRKDITRVPREQPGGSEMVLFRGQWPRHLIYIHPGGSPHGARPFIPPSFSFGGCARYDARSAWILCSMLLSVPELWETVTAGFKKYASWEPWTLSFLSKYLPHLSLPSRKNPFKVPTQSELFEKHIQRFNTHRGYDPQTIYDKFYETNRTPNRLYKSVCCQYDRFRPPSDNAIKITIVVNKVLAARGETVPTLFTRRFNEWELRFVCFSNISASPESHPQQWNGAAYMRHGKPCHNSWWRIGKDSILPTKRPPGWKIRDLGGSARNWNVCIFVRSKLLVTNELRDQVLRTCGGQSKLFCDEHRFPLIITGKNAALVCLKSSSETDICTNECRYRCPVSDCHAALCKHHFKWQCSSVPTGSTCNLKPAIPIDRAITLLQRKKDDDNSGSEKEPSAENGTSIPQQHGLTEPIDHPNLTPINDNPSQDYTFGSGTLQGTDDLGHAPTLMDYDSFPMMSGPQPCSEVPTTCAQEHPIHADITTPDLSTNKMTNHALLNCYGSCLIRRNARLSGTLKQQSFLQRLVATNTGTNIPLIYPEGMLFTDIFYCSNASQSIIGALPAALLHGDGILRQNGFATLQEHYCCRLTSPGLLTSSNPKYHLWAFDALANFSLRGSDSRIILQRGFAEMQDRGGVRLSGIREPIFDSDHVECRSLVNKICATCGIKMPTYFYTHTCSMMTHFGIRLLWRWLTSDELLSQECTEVTEREIQHWKKCLIESSGVYLLRVWMELIQIWLLYITKSPEEPAGKVEAQVARVEFQPTLDKNQKQVNKGNLPHLHCLFYTTDKLSTHQGLLAAADRIRGSVDDLVRPEEAKSYLDRGIFTSLSSIEDFKATMQRFLDHKHNHRCFVLRKAADSGHKVLVKACKATHNWKITPASAEHTFRELPVQHSQEAIRVMIDLGVALPAGADLAPGSTLRFVPLVDFLQSTKHIPPCMGKDGIMSPVIGVLVAINPNSDNCQLASGYYVARYLAKYVIKIDQYLTINFAPQQEQSPFETFSATAEQLHNTKITSNAIAQKESLSRGHNPKLKRSLGINVTDAYMKILGYPTVYTNLRHVRYTTETYDNRAAKFRKSKPVDRLTRLPTLQSQALTPLNTIPAHFIRVGNPLTPSWRNFTQGQVNKAFDDLHSPLTADPVTIFGRRCPELHFVRHQRLYFRWFKTETPRYTKTTRGGNVVTRFVKTLPQQIEYCGSHYSASDMLELTQWISTSSEVILLRVAALDELLAYFDASPLWVFGNHSFSTTFDVHAATAIKQQHARLLRTLKHTVNWCFHGIPPSGAEVFNDEMKERYKRLYDRFFTEPEYSILPTPWTTPVRPKQPIRFLIHLLFAYGAFIDEYTLFASGSLYNAFIASGLLDISNLQQSATKLMKKYFFHELKTLPAGTPTFDRYCVSANNIIHGFFHSRDFHYTEMPAVLYCRLKQDTSSTIKAFRLARRRRLVTCMRQKLFEYGIAPLPADDDFYNASLETPLEWDITNLQKPRGQPQQSYNEQLKALRIAKSRIDSYANATAITPNGCCFVGGGGVGKTTCAMISLLYACSRGLTINATALVSERAQELGVPHFNSDFCVPRADLHKVSTAQLAERIISSLYRKPENLEFHRTVDIEFVDEMGPIAAELWNSRDIVLRYIRNSTRPNGGKLDIVTFDHLQTHPIQGTHPLLSPFLTNIYTFHRLRHAVRASHVAWRRVQEITRLPPMQLNNVELENEFISLITTHCNFVNSEELAPHGALFVYGKNAPVRKRQRAKAKMLQKRVGRDVLTSTSEDFERNFEGKDVRASVDTIRKLDGSVREPSILYLYVGGRYRITFNDKSGRFSNGQLAFLHVLPDPSLLRQKRPISMLVAPPGCSYIPTETERADDLLAAGWTVTKVGIARDIPAKVGNTTAKRTLQYGLQLYVGSTWHSTMGKTLAQVATQVSSSTSRTDPFAIWDPTQVVIMLSRTRLPADTTFITKDPQGTASALFSILKRTSPFRNYLAYLVHNLCNSETSDGPPNTLDQSKSVFVPRDVLLPPDNTGFVYILISLKAHITYIGSCSNILLRLRRHNSGVGALQTAPEQLRPWAIMAYVCGFEGNELLYRGLENSWIAAKNRCLRTNTSSMTSTDIVAIGHSVMQEYNRDRGLSLRFVHAGALHQPATITDALHSSSPDSEQDKDSQLSKSQASDNALSDAMDAIPVGVDESDDSGEDPTNSRDSNDEGESSESDSGSDSDSESVPSANFDSDMSDHGRDDHFFNDDNDSFSGEEDNEDNTMGSE